MDEHRLVDANNIETKPFGPPFSSFAYVDKQYSSENSAIRRLFSLARSHSARTLMIEKIEPAGIILDENEEIKNYFPNNYMMTGLHRVSFWKSNFKVPDERVCNAQTCVGYAVLKKDKVISKNLNEWHVFEAVFRKYQHKHNCVPNSMQYKVKLGGIVINLKGLLYAQQNTLNKACAQVALRSVLSRIVKGDVSYKRINDLAQQVSPRTFNPADGLDAIQIRAVLTGFGIGFLDFDYTQYDDPNERARERESNPYQKYIYSGVESGIGALLGFRLTGPAIKGDLCHIIPFYGHTFNKDTWAPEADITYFRVGENLRYVSSENWTSSFLGHDDNFGPNFCVPRLYIPRDSVDYVVELLKPKAVFGGAQAEALALNFLYSVLNKIGPSKNAWLQRLAYYANPSVQLVVLRAIAVNRDKYIRHLSNETDWSQNSEDTEIITILKQFLPKTLWVIEISIPQLFPANERKLGEIVLNGECELGSDNSVKNSLFLLARLPCFYFFEYSKKKKLDFLRVPSKLTSHFPVIRLK
ncbi:MAG: hypothetical protein HW384_217 [Dehalococcoidia bacterium]|nr:hypothetical protein [Dehalococcoidia bacterium]MBF8303954.1 hypothetical protein [Dehalococcoidia bacterium]